MAKGLKQHQRAPLNSVAKKTARQRVVKRLDDVTSKYIRERDALCVQCKSQENLTNGHVFSRRSYSTRWDISKDGNCHCQCWGCNFKHSKDNYDYFKWYIDRFSNEEFDNLRFRYKETKKYTTAELEELYEEITTAYKELVNENEVTKQGKDNRVTRCHP